MALPMRSVPPQQRGLKLVHPRLIDSRRQPDRGEDFSALGQSPSSSRQPQSHSGKPQSSVLKQSQDRETRVRSKEEAGAALGAASSTRHVSGEPSPISGAMETSDAHLVALARVGEGGAFERLYRRHASYAMSLAVRVQGHAGDVEDIVHDAFLRVHDRLRELRADASFRPWLASIVVSLVRTRLRRRRMLSALGLVQSEPVELDALVHGDAGPEVRAQLAQVYGVLAETPVDQRICWTLRYIEGRKLEEVAEVAQCSLATAKRRIAMVQQRIVGLESPDSEDLSGARAEQDAEEKNP